MLKHPNLPSGGQILKIWTNGFWFLVTRQSLVTRNDPALFYFAIIFSDTIRTHVFSWHKHKNTYYIPHENQFQKTYHLAHGVTTLCADAYFVKSGEYSDLLCERLPCWHSMRASTASIHAGRWFMLGILPIRSPAFGIISGWVLLLFWNPPFGLLYLWK